MTEQPLLPPPPEPSDPNVLPRPPKRDLLPLFTGVGFLILAAAIFYLWQYPGTSSETAAQAAAIHTVEQHVADMDARLNALDPRLSALEQRPTVDLGKITARMDSLDAKLADQTRLASQLDTLSGRIESLSTRYQTATDANKRRLDTLAGEVAAQQSAAGNLDAVTKRLDRMTRLQEATLAFAAGRPIGDIPDAPAALARYAHTAPPTEAQLRLHFPQAEQAALAAQQTEVGDAPFINRVWERAQGLVTVRQGDDVVVGNSSATVLSQAKAALDAGDVAGAINTVETLNGQPKQAMANWLTDAKAFLNARTALADMANQA